MTTCASPRTAVRMKAALCGILTACALMGAGPCFAQGNDKQLREKADALFEKGKYVEALPLYSQLVSLSPADHDLNFKLGTCSIYGEDGKQKAIGFLKYAVQGPSTTPLAWYFLGRAYQLDYRFDEALEAYRHFSGTTDAKNLGRYPVEALQQQCANAKLLLNNIKDITVLNKVEVAASDFFRFYDLGDIGGKIVVTPDELLTSYDRKSGERFITYLPNGGGPVYFSSYGKNGATGRDIYRCELLPSGAYSTPVRLAGYVNTDQDEDFAVMSQDRKTLYFSSKGHNSMGGYDVFKSAFDVGMDVFGAAENMDFAVNTPADELLYITDATGKQACFASDRDSPQGMVNVYRVGTKQAPVNISVMQGVFASTFSPNDRKARITVEDKLTHERVADVSTTENGGYLLAVPRGGQYLFTVETGTGARKLLATVDVPNNETAVAYRQEMNVTGLTGEKLEIITHIDDPLKGDVMAVAMDEIRRRAKLDVTGERMEPVAVSIPADTGDPLARAGFDGSVTLASAKAMAQQEVANRRTEAETLSKQAERSYAMALGDLEQAEMHAASASDLVGQAKAASDPLAKETLLGKAAMARDEAEIAGLRAKAAYRAAQVLDSAALGTNKEAVQAATIANAVDQGIASGNNANLTDALKQLKAAVDLRNGPTPQVDNAERLRREASEASTTAAKKVQQAMTAREDETELAQRLDSKRREAGTAKGGKRSEAERELVDMEASLGAMHDEVEEAFRKARTAERNASAARGTASLVKFLATEKDVPGASVPADQIRTIGARIDQVQDANAALDIPEEYRPASTETAEQRLQRMFDWGSVSGGSGTTTAATNARTGGPGSGSATTSTDARAEKPPASKPVGAPGASPSTVTAPSDDRAASSVSTSTAQVVPPSERHTTSTHAGDTTPTRKEPLAMAEPVAGQAPVEDRSAGSKEGGEVVSGSVTSDGPDSELDTDAANVADSIPVDPNEGTDVPEGSISEGDRTEPTDLAMSQEDRAFYVANNIAELKQLRESAPDRATRDSLDAVIRDQRKVLVALDKASSTTSSTTIATATGTASPGAGTIKPPAEEVKAEVPSSSPEQEEEAIDKGTGSSASDTASVTATWNDTERTQASDSGYRMAYSELAFDPAMLDADLVEELVPNFLLLYQRAQDMEGTPQEKAIATRQLMQRLADSIDARAAVQTAYLKDHPQDSLTVRARLERLRGFKERRATIVRTLVDDTEQAASPTAPVSGQAAPGDLAVGPIDTAETVARPENGPAPDADLDHVYGTPVAYRSAAIRAEAARRDSALASMQALYVEVDSVRALQKITPPGAEHDRLRAEGDSKSDELMKLQTRMGQRMGLIADLEYKIATDSARASDRTMVAKGLPPDAPLWDRAKSLDRNAKQEKDQATELRKAAERATDPAGKDSLYRQAWAGDIRAFRSMDSASVVRKYLLREDARPTEGISFAEVEHRMRNAPTVVPPVRADERKEVPSPMPSSAPPPGQVAQEPPSTIPASTPPAAQVAQAIVDTLDVPSAPSPNGVGLVAEQADVSDRAPVAQHDTVAAPVHGAVLQLPPFMERYYALGPDIRDRLLSDAESRAYFMLQGSAMHHADSARWVATEADDLYTRAEGLRKAASSARNSSGAYRIVEAERMEALATVLSGRSDSLRLHALRQSHDAALDKAAAEQLLNGLSEFRSARIASLEASSRRTATPGIEQVQVADRPASGVEPLSPVHNAVPSAPKGFEPNSQAPDSVLVSTVSKSEAVPMRTDGSGATTSGTDTRAEVVRDSAAVRPNTRAVEPVAVKPVPSIDPLVRSEGTITAADRTPGSVGTGVPLPGPAARLTMDRFEMEPRTHRDEPIPVDVPMPRGVVYKVQVGAFRHELPVDAFSDMTPVTGERVGNGLTRYTAGMFTTAQGAAAAGELVRSRGYHDAFVVAYVDGARVSLKEAIALERLSPVAMEAGTASAVPPAAAVQPAVGQPAVASAAPDPEIGMLEKYPATAQEVLASFKPDASATAYYDDPTAAPAKQVETVQGLFFTVQVGVYSKPTALDRLFNITPLNSERTSNNKIRYTTGVFLDPAVASVRKDATVGLGVKDAFVTAYLNGVRIPVQEGRALLKKFGAAILADPSIGTR